jgi:hypothetical protein
MSGDPYRDDRDGGQGGGGQGGAETETPLLRVRDARLFCPPLPFVGISAGPAVEIDGLGYS